MWYRGGRRWHRSGSDGSLKKLGLDDRFFLLLSQKAVTSDAMNIPPDLSDDDLSSAMGTETLLAHDLVPEGLPAYSKGPTELQIWQDGMKLRALGVLASVVEQ
jgi:hypothetical protein